MAASNTALSCGRVDRYSQTLEPKTAANAFSPVWMLPSSAPQAAR